MKVIQKLFVIVILSVFLISMAVATASAVNLSKDEKKDTGIIIESKSKIVSYKVTWNANNGKIGNQKKVTTTVKKGSKVKMVTTPKRSGYIFKGWSTTKNGAKKITKNTKPTKNVTYYAQWRLKLLGIWKDSSNTFVFNKSGEFSYIQPSGSKSSVTEGKFKVSGRKIYLKKIVFNPGKTTEQQRNDTVFEYKFVKDSGGEYLLIPTVFNDMPYVDISYGTGLRRD